MMKYDGILFDLDGTLWDSVDQLTPAWQRVLGEYGVKTDAAQLRSMMGKTAEYFAAALLPMLPPPEGLAVIARCCREELFDLAKTGGTLYPQLEATLAPLSETHKLFIVSNCQKGYIETFLTAHDLRRYFTDWENHEQTGLSKADNIRLVVSRNGLNAPVYVGDTESDECSANEAGVPFIHAAYGFGTAKHPIMALRHISELLDFLP